MKKTFITAVLFSALAVPAFAADLPSVKGPPVYAPPPPPVFSWTGVYIGGQIGYEWGRTSSTTYFEPTGDAVLSQEHNDNGVVGGGHLGYNLQFNQFVVGIEGDVNGSGYEGSNTLLDGLYFTHTRIPFDGSIRARVGVAFDRILIYGTGGAAFASIHESSEDFIGDVDSQTVGRVGWTVGGGLEYAITNNWSVRAEYRYTDYGRNSLDITNELPFAPPGILTARVHQTDNRAQVGFSYKFDTFAPPAPVVAKY